MTALGGLDLGAVGDAVRRQGLDGWLVFDFHGVNPIARRLLGVRGMLTRRVFVWLPATGEPRAVVHTLDRPVFEGFPGAVDEYRTWEELHRRLAALVAGRRCAMELSPEDAVPYLDRVPAGVVELLVRLGATLVPSAPLVTQFAARWSAAELAGHRRTAEMLAELARRTLADAVTRAGAVGEVRVQRQVLEGIEAAELETDDPPIVAFGPNAADPHYAPREGADRTLAPGDVVLLDLWARPGTGGVWADQTWMGYAGSAPPADVASAWNAVRGARDAVVERLRAAARRGETVTGAALDRVAREHVTARGFGAHFVHRTGHSIEAELHGSGPHLDDFETHDERELLPGIGFSVEPGVYLAGRFGVRSEINVVLGPEGPEVTPAAPQDALIVSA